MIDVKICQIIDLNDIILVDIVEAKANCERTEKSSVRCTVAWTDWGELSYRQTAMLTANFLVAHS